MAQVKPTPGREVPDPEKGGFLPPEGRAVEATAYWLRRIADGDVTEVEAKPTKRKGAEA
ncbi:MAG: DUF2635 domain-containing protein [Zetaproteobacteria bacterium CG23_combo_of_CG06-09_8_20_14_all_54_7]|nr:MAG: DUF2635 domain-containing protein [Zetaproteobacteria bacterium CG23_combo_of_CG06-09_8_20_14_all_54_7]